jgi:uncharacterized protein YdaU (DUF1376 family)
MSGAPYMRFYFGDYDRDTGHLRGALEHGAYFMLIKAMWNAGGRLPGDDKRLARLAQLSDKEWTSVRDVILPFFKRRGGHIRHKRIDAELAVYHNTIVQAQKAGKQSARQKLSKNNAKSSTDVEPTFNQPEPEPEPERRSKEASSFIGGSKNERGRADLRRTTTDARRAAWAEAIAERHRCEAGDQAHDSGGPGCADLDGSRGLRLAHAREA